MSWTQAQCLSYRNAVNHMLSSASSDTHREMKLLLLCRGVQHNRCLVDLFYSGDSLARPKIERTRPCIVQRNQFLLTSEIQSFLVPAGKCLPVCHQTNWWHRLSVMQKVMWYLSCFLTIWMQFWWYQCQKFHVHHEISRNPPSSVEQMWPGKTLALTRWKHKNPGTFVSSMHGDDRQRCSFYSSAVTWS
jgi:hypothetical protein